jgi:cytochrome o ubiquinol oxidase operon protein cyoD
MSGSETPRGSLKSYATGFIASLALTAIAYLLVSHKVSGGGVLIFYIIGLALVQLFVQLIYFLHLGRESRPRWNITVFSFAAMVVLILVLGSLWIMNHLNYHHEPAAQQDQSIIKDEGVQVQSHGNGY